MMDTTYKSRHWQWHTATQACYVHNREFDLFVRQMKLTGLDYMVHETMFKYMYVESYEVTDQILNKQTNILTITSNLS